jgi:hypothetical protein
MHGHVIRQQWLHITHVLTTQTVQAMPGQHALGIPLELHLGGLIAQQVHQKLDK